MLLISQKSWNSNDVAGLGGQLDVFVASAERYEVGEPIKPVVLLPIAETGVAPPDRQALLLEIGNLVAERALYVAGAALVKDKTEKAPFIVGFLIGPDGQILLNVRKHSPELINGLAVDQTCALASPAEMQSAMTPIGQIGILPGEDILFPHLARALVWKGAELILNPAAEVSDERFTSRQNARVARAFENCAYIATASALNSGDGKTQLNRPAASGFADWSGQKLVNRSSEDILKVDVYIDQLRRKRTAIFSVQALHLRANLYAEGYRKMIAAEPKPSAAPTNRAEWAKEAQRRVAKIKASAGTGKETEYDVLLVQSVKKMIQKTSDVGAMITENIQRALELPARTASNPNVRLVALSEFFMTGQGGHGYRSPITLQRLAIRYPGPEMELLSEFALKHKTYVAGSTFEIDDKLPGYVFNSAFILNDSGDLIHRYRKIQCADVWGSLPDTTPGTIYKKYLDTYGYDFLFPVCDTPLGKLGTMVCFDQAHPEI
ncbi:MAG: hypothetical protein KDE14_00140, partial [Rhodobacteraceae bacterium]|nr:hypothetical protein [Paracoccaceae bacterium]